MAGSRCARATGSGPPRPSSLRRPKADPRTPWMAWGALGGGAPTSMAPSTPGNGPTLRTDGPGTMREPRDLRTVGDLFCSAMLAAEVTLEADRFEQWNRHLFEYMSRYNHPDVLTF